MQSTTESEHNTLFNYLDTAASIFLVIDPSGNVALVNKKGCEILGYKREEIEGQNWFTNFIPKDESGALFQLFDDIIEGQIEAPDSYENTIVARGGELKLIRWRNSLLKDDDGLVKGLISSGVDITKEANAHATLFLRNRALEAAGNGIIIADAKKPDLPIIYCNSAFTKLTGYEENEVLGKNCRFLQNDDRDQEAIVTMARAIQKGEACRVVVRNYRKNGSLFWNEVSIRPLHDPDNRLTHFIGVQNDITEIQQNKRKLEQYASTLEDKVAIRTREIAATVEKLVAANLSLEQQILETRQAEVKAQQGHALFAAIAKNFPKGIIVVFNTALELTYIEGEELGRISKKKSDFEGKHIDQIPLLTKEQIKTVKKEIIATLNGKSLSLETVYEHNTYSVNSTPLYSDKEETMWALFVYHNITEQKNVQQELAKALETEKELNELKSRFISMASHEFRTPLSAILSSAILIGKQNEPGKEANRLKHVGRIRDNVKNLVVILNDFLSLSKLEEGKVKAKPETLELIQFSNLLVEEMEASRKNGQIIILKSANTTITARLDPKLLSHILVNLLSNACKYSDENTEIQLEIVRHNKEVVFRITDHGIGIPAEEHKNLFERFFRARNVTNIQGTGLGLHIVRQYTRLMGGEVNFRSKEGKGSTFEVQLPLNLNEYENNITD